MNKKDLNETSILLRKIAKKIDIEDTQKTAAVITAIVGLGHLINKLN